MKKDLKAVSRILLFTCLLLAIFYAQSGCKREAQSGDNSMSMMAEEARKWFRDVVVRNEDEMLAQSFDLLPSLDNRRKLARMRTLSLKLDWDKAKESEYNGFRYLITPVRESNTPFENNKFEAYRSFIFFKNGEGKMELQIVEIIGKKGLPLGGNPYEITNAVFINKRFKLENPVSSVNAGVLFYDVNYVRESAFQLNEGKWTKAKIALKNVRGGTMERPVSTAAAKTTCFTCPNWYLIGIWFDLVTGEIISYEILDTYQDPSCYGVPPEGYGSSAEPEEDMECANELAMVASGGSEINEHGSIVLCAQNGNTRTKCYSWRVWTQSSGMFPTYLVSNEEAVQKFENGRWYFDELVHKGIVVDGPTIGYTLSAESVAAHPSLLSHAGVPKQVGQMHLGFTAQVCIICRGNVCCWNSKYQNKINSWHVNE